MTKKPICPRCFSDDVKATAWVRWLPDSNRYSVRYVVPGSWACMACNEAGMANWIDFDPIWIDVDGGHYPA